MDQVYLSSIKSAVQDHIFLRVFNDANSCIGNFYVEFILGHEHSVPHLKALIFDSNIPYSKWSF